VRECEERNAARRAASLPATRSITTKELLARRLEQRMGPSGYLTTAIGIPFEPRPRRR
jgi:hypothetical protein